ncbi:hypothetical protein CALCODRAFT_484868 [Calocera cornea HHB12733]|uniref:Uncharacterized protein n=1 Tax=Calocera cornea HHB12733 TaxID=1353952 RepID=A0A165EQ81_9BASI|nr:hypothetical protein CALCODRAFT_484868 [Calocera cornea HHB12733]
MANFIQRQPTGNASGAHQHQPVQNPLPPTVDDPDVVPLNATPTSAQRKRSAPLDGHESQSRKRKKFHPEPIDLTQSDDDEMVVEAASVDIEMKPVESSSQETDSPVLNTAQRLAQLEDACLSRTFVMYSMRRQIEVMQRELDDAKAENARLRAGEAAKVGRSKPCNV